MRIKSLQSRGFTLVEMMIIVAIIGLLAALVVPHALRAREEACIQTIKSNLRIIEDSKCIWAMEQRAGTGVEPSEDDLVAYMKGQELPQPVAGERYQINPVGMLATATLTQTLVGLPIGSELTLLSEQ